MGKAITPSDTQVLSKGAHPSALPEHELLLERKLDWIRPLTCLGRPNHRRISVGKSSSYAAIPGFNTTLMHPSVLSRNVLYISGPRSSGTSCVITNDGSICPSTTF